MSLSITVRYTQEFRRLAISGNTAAKLADNEVGSTGSRYSSTPFQLGKGMLSSSSVPHDCKDAYKSYIFSGFVASPPPVENVTFYFILLPFSSLSVSNVLPYSIILEVNLPTPQFRPGIKSWWITVFFSSTLLLLLLLYLMFSCFSCIKTGNETGSPSDFLGASLDLCGTIISSLN